MKKNLFYIISATMLIFAAGCSDMADVEPAVDSDALTEANAPDQNLQGENLKKDLTKDEKFLKNVKVEGDLLGENGDVVGSFVGKATITSFSYEYTIDPITGPGLLASGVITGIATLSDGTEIDVKKTFSDIEVTLADGSAASNAKVAVDCQILFLDIGPIHLDLLGLQVDLSRIVLDITAVSGEGNLLGNLLCSVAGLLDPLTGLLELIGFLEDLLNLLEDINKLLG